MKQQIEDMLRPIVVEPLSDMWRYPGCQYFEFGVQRPHKNRKGQDVTWSDWHLGVECDWRITGPAGYIVSSDDYGPGYNRRDEMAHPFFDMLHDDPPIVEAIDADEQGGLCIRMSRGYTLEIQPVDWPLDEDQWRFWCDANAEEYFVVTRGGIQNRTDLSSFQWSRTPIQY